MFRMFKNRMYAEDVTKGYRFSSTYRHRRFQELTLSKVFKKLWIRLLQVYDEPSYSMEIVDMALTVFISKLL